MWCDFVLQVKRRQRVLQGRAPRRFHRGELLSGFERPGLDVEGFGVLGTEYANQALTESVEDRHGFDAIFARGLGALVEKYANVHFDVNRVIMVGAEPALGKRKQFPFHVQSFVVMSRLHQNGGEITTRTDGSLVLLAVQSRRAVRGSSQFRHGQIGDEGLDFFFAGPEQCGNQAVGCASMAWIDAVIHRETF